jgi:hypothetical protein
VPIERDFLDLMPHTVALAKFTGNRNQFGKPIHDDANATTYPARVVRGQRLVRDTNGAEVVATATVYVLGAPAVTPEDKLTLQDGTSPPILNVGSKPDERGDHHVVIYIG